ncbi:sigma-70 family RNA polymerase sigma factor [Brachyspira intermedia]|uniref:sigma-70 family RNA polymerase sigma factor n=1 Tax=Brachyspira intermedia TaxID=84377 RepID=UPI003006AC77
MKQFLSDEEIKLLIKEYQKNNSISARNKIINEFYFLIRKMSNKIYYKYHHNFSNIFDYEDCIQWGILGLINAVEIFDLEYNNKFLTYAVLRINGNIIDEIRKATKNSSKIKNKRYIYSLEVLETIENKDGNKIISEKYISDYKYNPEELYLKDINLYKRLLIDFYNNNVFYNEIEKKSFEDYFFKGERIIDIARKNNVSESLICHAVKDLKNKVKRYYQDNYC